MDEVIVLNCLNKPFEKQGKYIGILCEKIQKTCIITAGFLGFLLLKREREKKSIRNLSCPCRSLFLCVLTCIVLFIFIYIVWDGKFFVQSGSDI